MGNEGKNFDLKKIHFPVDFCCFNDRVQQKRISNVMTVKNWLQMEYCKHTGLRPVLLLYGLHQRSSRRPQVVVIGTAGSHTFFLFLFFQFFPTNLKSLN